MLPYRHPIDTYRHYNKSSIISGFIALIIICFSCIGLYKFVLPHLHEKEQIISIERELLELSSKITLYTLEPKTFPIVAQSEQNLDWEIKNKPLIRFTSNKPHCKPGSSIIKIDPLITIYPLQEKFDTYYFVEGTIIPNEKIHIDHCGKEIKPYQIPKFIRIEVDKQILINIKEHNQWKLNGDEIFYNQDNSNAPQPYDIIYNIHFDQVLEYKYPEVLLQIELKTHPQLTENFPGAFKNLRANVVDEYKPAEKCKFLQGTVIPGNAIKVLYVQQQDGYVQRAGIDDVYLGLKDPCHDNGEWPSAVNLMHSMTLVTKVDVKKTVKDIIKNNVWILNGQELFSKYHKVASEEYPVFTGGTYEHSTVWLEIQVPWKFTHRGVIEEEVFRGAISRYESKKDIKLGTQYSFVAGVKIPTAQIQVVYKFSAQATTEIFRAFDSVFKL